MNSITTRQFWSRGLIALGGLAMLLGAADPLEGSVVILLGAGLVTFGMFLGPKIEHRFAYWLSLFIAMALGVGAMFALSAVGGLGGKHGHSWWWGLLMLPYPVAWLLGVANLAANLARKLWLRLRPQPSPHTAPQ